LPMSFLMTLHLLSRCLQYLDIYLINCPLTLNFNLQWKSTSQSANPIMYASLLSTYPTSPNLSTYISLLNQEPLIGTIITKKEKQNWCPNYLKSLNLLTSRSKSLSAAAQLILNLGQIKAKPKWERKNFNLF
jgi:hypothetical protein